MLAPASKPENRRPARRRESQEAEVSILARGENGAPDIPVLKFYSVLIRESDQAQSARH